MEAPRKSTPVLSVEYVVGVWIKTPASEIPIARQVVVTIPLAEGETIDTSLPAHAAPRFERR